MTLDHWQNMSVWFSKLSSSFSYLRRVVYTWYNIEYSARTEVTTQSSWIRNILICWCMQKHIQHNKDERTQFFRKIYLSLYLKGFERVTKDIICERWVGDWTELQHIDTPPTLLVTAGFLSRSHGLLNLEPGAQPLLGHGSHSSIFSLTDLNFLSHRII